MGKRNKILLILVALTFGIILFLSFHIAQAAKCTGCSGSKSLDPNGPYFQQIFTATSRDGLNWTKQNRMLFNHASVPGAVFKDGIIYLYFADGQSGHVTVAKSSDNGQSYTSEWVISPRLPVDPHPEVFGNKIRLYFNDNNMVNGRISSKRMVYAESEDGVHFGNLTTIQSNLKGVTDPDFIKTTQDARILASRGRKIIYYISNDGGNTFGREIRINWNKGAVSDTVRFGNTYRTYYCSGKTIGSATGIETGKLRDEGARLVMHQGTRYICAPSVIQIGDGTYLMYYTILI